MVVQSEDTPAGPARGQTCQLAVPQAPPESERPSLQVEPLEEVSCQCFRNESDHRRRRVTTRRRVPSLRNSGQLNFKSQNFKLKACQSVPLSDSELH